MEELRPVPPAPKKKPSLLFRLLAFLLTLALLLGAVAAVVYRDKLNFDGIRRWFTYRALERSDSGQAESFRYESSGRGGFSNVGGDLLVWSTAGARLYSTGGVEYFSDPLSLTAPMADVWGDAALVYDAGGYTLRIYRDRAPVFSLDTEPGHEILSARMGPGEMWTVATQETGYKGIVTVYDGDAPVMAVRRTRLVMDGILSEDGDTVAVLTIGQEGNAFESILDLYALEGDEPFASFPLGNNAVLDLRASSGVFWALGESALDLVAQDGSARVSYDYGGEYLKDFDLGGDGFAALLRGWYRAGSAATLVTVDASGEVLGALDLEEQVLDLSAAGRYVGVLTASGLTLYTRDLEVYRTLDGAVGVWNVVLREDGTALLVGNDTARLYIPD